MALLSRIEPRGVATAVEQAADRLLVGLIAPACQPEAVRSEHQCGSVRRRHRESHELSDGLGNFNEIVIRVAHIDRADAAHGTGAYVRPRDDRDAALP